MRIDSILQKAEVYAVAAVAVVLVSGLAFALSSPFPAQDYGVSDESTIAHGSSRSSSAASQSSQPALLEPALRSLDGVAHHG